MSGEALAFRRAVATDAPVIAALHAESWRSAYRGILSDAYLDGPVAAERLALWQARFGGPDPFLVILAEDGAGLAGFVAVFPGDHGGAGPLVENLHVRPDRRGRGIGRRLLAAAVAALPDDARHGPLHLWVYAGNSAARAAYERLGGVLDQRQDEIAPDGSMITAVRFVWPRADVLAVSRSYLS